MGSPRAIVERSESFAEMLLEGKVTPAQGLLNTSCDLAAAANQAGELSKENLTATIDHVAAVMIADMEWLRAQLAVAWRCGYEAANEDRDRRGVHGARVRK